MVVIVDSDCKCRRIKKSTNGENVDICLLKKSPCRLLTGWITSIKWTWVRCKNSNGEDRIECNNAKGNAFYEKYDLF